MPKERKNPVRSMLPVWLGHEGFGRPGAGERLVDSVRLEEGGVRSVDDFPLVFFSGTTGTFAQAAEIQKGKLMCFLVATGAWWERLLGFEDRLPRQAGQEAGGC